MIENNTTEFRNETLQSIHRRHSIRQFIDKAIAGEDIRTILEAANQAPSAHNQQSWRFIIIEGNKKTKLTELIMNNIARFPRPTSALLRMAARSISSAPVVIAVVNTGELIHRGPELFETDKNAVRDFFRVMEIQSSAAAVENMLIAATSLGLSSVWLGILIMIQKDVLEFLQQPGGEFMAVIPIGYAQKASSGPKKRSLNVAVEYLK
jgi:nitroreductase